MPGTTSITDTLGLTASAGIPVPGVPEPATLALLGLGLAGLGWSRRQRATT